MGNLKNFLYIFGIETQKGTLNDYNDYNVEIQYGGVIVWRSLWRERPRIGSPNTHVTTDKGTTPAPNALTPDA